MPKKRLKRIQWDIVGRLVVVIRNHPNMKKTKIAMRSGLSYDKCRLYLDWMETLDLIKRRTQDGFEVVSLTDRGNELYVSEFENHEFTRVILVS